MFFLLTWSFQFPLRQTYLDLSPHILGNHSYTFNLAHFPQEIFSSQNGPLNITKATTPDYKTTIWSQKMWKFQNKGPTGTMHAKLFYNLLDHVAMCLRPFANKGAHTHETQMAITCKNATQTVLKACLTLLQWHNIIQIHNVVSWDWHYSMEQSWISHFQPMMWEYPRILHEILLVHRKLLRIWIMFNNNPIASKSTQHQ